MFLGLLGNKQNILKMTETVVESSDIPDITNQARLQPQNDPRDSSARNTT